MGHPVNCAPTSAQLHPPPPILFQPPLSSIHPHPAHFSLHPALCNTLNNIQTKISRNWAISPNLGRKIQICLFWLKIGSHGILEVAILNPDLDLWNSNPKIHFLANLGPKRQSCPFCLKIGTHGISRMLILFPTLVFWIFNPKIPFWANLGQKSQICQFYLKIGTHGISRMWILILKLVFWVLKPKEVKLPVLSDVVTQHISGVRFVSSEICNWRR